MEQTDIIQEYANQNPGLQPTQESTDIISEFANKLASEQQEVSHETNNESETNNEEVEDQVELSNDFTNESTIEEPSNSFEEDENLSFVNDEQEDDEVLDESDFIKARTGGKFESWEQVEEELTKERGNIEFENETSLAIYNLLAEGKINEVTDILQKKAFAESIKDKSNEEVLKAYIKQTNPEFDSEDIEDEYNEKYTIDEFAFDDSKFKREQKKLNQRIKGDVDAAKEYFTKSAEEIKFPTYTKQVEQEVEEVNNGISEQEQQEERNKFLQTLSQVEKSVNSIPFNWKDEKANMSISGKFEIPAQEISKYKEKAENLENYYLARYYQDGQYKADQLLRDLYISDNFNKIVNSAVSQAVNQTRLDLLKKSKNITVDTQQSATYRPSDADEEMGMYDKLFMGHLTK
jgi:hypothetical protein